eukprot:1144038-Pelagomonas_calceolata.AAC.2
MLILHIILGITKIRETGKRTVSCHVARNFESMDTTKLGHAAYDVRLAYAMLMAFDRKYGQLTLWIGASLWWTSGLDILLIGDNSLLIILET